MNKRETVERAGVWATHGTHLGAEKSRKAGRHTARSLSESGNDVSRPLEGRLAAYQIAPLTITKGLRRAPCGRRASHAAKQRAKKREAFIIRHGDGPHTQPGESVSAVRDKDPRRAKEAHASRCHQRRPFSRPLSLYQVPRSVTTTKRPRARDRTSTVPFSARLSLCEPERRMRAPDAAQEYTTVTPGLKYVRAQQVDGLSLPVWTGG